MSTERMMCCGALTKVYSDAGKRRHESFCDGKIKSNKELIAFIELHDVPGVKPVSDVTFDNPITGKRVGKRYPFGDVEKTSS